MACRQIDSQLGVSISSEVVRDLWQMEGALDSLTKLMPRNVAYFLSIGEETWWLYVATWITRDVAQLLKTAPKKWNTGQAIAWVTSDLRAIGPKRMEQCHGIAVPGGMLGVCSFARWRVRLGVSTLQHRRIWQVDACCG